MSKKPWPTSLTTETDLAGFLRRKMESVGGSLTAFKTAERFLRDILADWQDAYEIAVVYNAAIDADGPSERLWSLLDLRAYVRLRRQYGPLPGTAYYVYQALFAAEGADRQDLLALVEDLEDAIVAKNSAKRLALRKELDARIRGLDPKPA